ncbi:MULTISPECIES: LysR family transcriptional regulator [unclassified Herbaspirillum]|uniref:LysR family transcriptional regulator n=1 Tax=unclassified Herbaspirillum TaxID=2624150 RepID=UPI000E2F3601|nr:MULTISPECIES: LysR family transcriptional regulator [unclassified Herbaspirillum]RFB73381.1 LysR family transcriptional regulator [Herbaspirillum sp. 3R-3a1]TFI10815.1 LysR family transcriptional regulator [Herbaspirillum sp. 3R11]TFI16722.1 LysR family transcriptional regulator [Herbaspirillum sp. 3R-11]TFI26769.1 LysR family transcriptional regulator [Herbaspirillum sp. 3C11]
MLFDLTDLRLFILIAELNSLTRSAERMNLSLAATSNRIKELETRFGMRLLYRESKGVQLTPAGQTFLSHAQQFMQQVERLKGDMQQYNNGIKGYIRIFANTTAVTEFMPEILGKFLTLHPQVNVALEERLNHDIMRGIQEGTADIGIVAGPVQGEGLEILNFSTDRLVLATALEHPLAGIDKVSFAETLEYEHVGLHEGSTLHHFLNRIVSESGQRLKLRIQVRSFEAMCRMVETNVGIGIVPHSAALRHKQTMQLSLTELTDPWSVRERSMVVQSLDALPLYARDLVEFIRQQTAQVPPVPVEKEAA